MTTNPPNPVDRAELEAKGCPYAERQEERRAAHGPEYDIRVSALADMLLEAARMAMFDLYDDEMERGVSTHTQNAARRLQGAINEADDFLKARRGGS